MKTWDVVIVGGGIIGLSLSIELRKRGAQVLIVERGEPGREASHAAAGMLVGSGGEAPVVLRPLAGTSARMYPEFVHELEDESGMRVDLRAEGTLVFPGDQPGHEAADSSAMPLPEPLAKMEPALADRALADPARPAFYLPAFYLKERSVDPRALTVAALKAAKHREVDVASGSPVTAVLVSDGRVSGVSTDRAHYAAPVVVNCAGAWAGQLLPHRFPTRPVKGQMLSVVGAAAHLIRHVIRAPEVYLVPRSDGRILIGSTLEDAGYDKRTDANTIRRLHQAAIHLVPALGQARVLEDWAGLRPGTPDDLPILGLTSTPGYFVAAGHFRDGILLAPVTARVMSQLITGVQPEHDISAFSPGRF